MAVSEEATKGGYLLFDVSSQGSLFLKWSTTRPEKALMFFKPTKSVPAFKYKGQGKEEICRKLTVNAPGYFKGVTEFVKMAKIYHGELTVFDHPDLDANVPPIGITFMKGQKLQHIQNNESYLITDQTAVSAWHESRKIYQGVQTMSQSSFLNKAQNSGNSWAIEFSN